MDTIKIVKNNDNNFNLNTTKLNSSNNIKIVSNSDNIKSNDNINIMNENDSLQPNFNEIDSDDENELRPQLTVPNDDLNLLANPKKNKGFRSSESEYESEDNLEDEYDSQDNDNISEVSVNENNNFKNMNLGNNLYNDEDEEDEQNNNIGQGFNMNDNDNQSVSSIEEERTNESSGSRRMPPPRQKTEEEIMQEKQELLYRLERFEKAGSKPSRRFNMNSKYEDIKCEYDKIKKQRDIDKSIKFQRKVLMALSSGIEFLNGKFDPFNVKLDGWSESMYENVGDYDEVFEELHEKYKEKVQMAPEIKLLMMVGGSAFMFHLSNTLFKSKMPGLNDILKQNPDLMRNVQTAAMNGMKNNMEESGEGNDPMFNMMMNGAQMTMNKRAGPTIPPEMKGPSGVDDILNQLNNTTSVDNNETTNSSISSTESVNRRIKIKKSKRPDNKFVFNSN